MVETCVSFKLSSGINVVATGGGVSLILFISSHEGALSSTLSSVVSVRLICIFSRQCFKILSNVASSSTA